MYIIAFGANTFCSSFQLLWEMREQFLVDVDFIMVPELNQMATKIVQRASMCDLKAHCQRAINDCLDDSVRQGIFMVITKPQSSENTKTSVKK